MILLKDSVEIETTPERLFDWFDNLPAHYLAWHPDHVACRFLKGEAFQEGTVLYAEEYLHGKLHRLKFRATRVLPNDRLEYQLFPGMKGGFIIRPLNGTVRFTATLAFGTGMPVIGRILDLLLGRVLAQQLDAMRQHMREEGENLKHLLETAPASSGG
ncbi:MAG: SRPBCC family protein [Fidelibacterota bacterium]|nr:MAG: SRPBCC family protein [Candidatus Neomarinimicrobiota bacterium]